VDLGVTTYLDEGMMPGLAADVGCDLPVTAAPGSSSVDDYDASSLLSYSYRSA